MTKATRITSIILMALPSLMLAMSAVMKLSHAQQIVDGFSKSALINYIDLIGGIELISVILLWIPKTQKIGFLLLNAYLGGAISIELAGGQFPNAAVFLAVLWVGVYLKEKPMFVRAAKFVA
jgi:hypothetical protein